MSRTIYDALIIGAGPAGLTTALGLGRVMRTAMVFDSLDYRNAGAKALHVVPSRDGVDPQEFRRLTKEQIETRYGEWITFATAGTEVVYASKATLSILGDRGQDRYQGFEVADSQGRRWQGRKLVLATGSRDILPDLPGFRENWPTNM